MESFSPIFPLFLNIFGGDFSFCISFHYPCYVKLHITRILLLATLQLLDSDDSLHDGAALPLQINHNSANVIKIKL